MVSSLLMVREWRSLPIYSQLQSCRAEDYQAGLNEPKPFNEPLDLRIVHRTKSNRYNPTNPNPLMNLWMVLDLRIVRRTKSNRHNATNPTNPNSLINLWIILERLDPQPRKLSRPGSQWITLLNNTCTQSKNAQPPKKYIIIPQK